MRLVPWRRANTSTPTAPAAPVVYQLKVVLHGVSPMIWQRLLVRSDGTIADLHVTLQLAIGWTGEHLQRFVIDGKDYGITQIGGIGFLDDPHRAQLADKHRRPATHLSHSSSNDAAPDIVTQRRSSAGRSEFEQAIHTGFEQRRDEPFQPAFIKVLLRIKRSKLRNYEPSESRLRHYFMLLPHRDLAWFIDVQLHPSPSCAAAS